MRYPVRGGRIHRAIGFAIFLFVAVFQAACSGSSTPDTTAPTAELDQSGLPLGSGRAIVVSFSETIDTGSLSLGGTLLSPGYTTAWSSTSYSNDTLTITPTSSWSVGAATLTIDATDTAPAPNAMTTLNKNYDVMNGMVGFVDSAAADDLGDGLSPGTAKRTINEAITVLAAPATVVVNGGTYNVSSDPASLTQVYLKENIDLLGGYNADFTARDPNTYQSNISDTSTMAGTLASPNHAVRVDMNLTTATLVDGFVINATASADANAYTSAIWMTSNGGIDLQHCVVSGATSGRINYTVYMEGTGVSNIANNTIYGGSPSMTSYALGLFKSSGVSTVSNNTLTGGDSANGASSSYGMMITGTPAHTISGNTIQGGSASFGRGLFVTSNSTAVIESNTIEGGAGSITNAIIVGNGASPVIRNNTIDGAGLSASTGIEISLATNAQIYGNRINGGNGSGSAVEMVSGTATVYNNMILGPTGSGLVSGIRMAGGTLTLRNNTIHSGVGGSSSYGLIAYGGTYAVDNNIFMTSNSGNSYCFAEQAVSADPSSVRNNDFTSCSTAFYLDYVDGTGCGSNDVCIATAANINALGDTTASGNVSDAPALTDLDGDDNVLNTLGDNDWTFSGSSPAAVTAGGLNGIDAGGWGYTTDMAGVTRPGSGNPWSIGAFEP